MSAGAAPAVIDRIRRNLVGLKMPRALEILDVTLRGIERGETSALEAIDVLLTEELTLRENRRVKMALIMARLSAIKTLAGFDFSFQPSLDKNRIMALAELQFIDRAEVVHLIGPPGTGKSHLSLALGVEAVKTGRSVYFGSLADIVAALAKAEREGALRERIRFFCRFALLIVDEIGYLPVIPGGGNLFFQLVNARYEKGAMILTSNRGFAEWGEIFGDPVVATALLDRLLHHAVVFQIEGSSYRLRQHADLVPEHIRTKASLQPSPIPPNSQAARPAAKKRRPRSRRRLIAAPARVGNFGSALLGKIKSAFTVRRKAADCCRELWRATLGVGNGAAQRVVFEPIVHVAPVGARRPAERGCRAGACSCGDRLYAGSGIDVRAAATVFGFCAARKSRNHRDRAWRLLRAG